MIPSCYLGNNLTMNWNETMDVSSEQYINEVLQKFQDKHGSIREENVLDSHNDHPEEDGGPLLSEEGET